MACGPKGKCCCACAVCVCFVIAAMVPVSLFVILPKMVQSNLDSAEFVLNNVSMLTCDGWSRPAFYAELINNASMENTGPVSVTIHPYTVTLSAYMCEDADGSMKGGHDCSVINKSAKETVIGNFTAPEATLGKGPNVVLNTVRLNVNNATETNGGFIIPLVFHPGILVFASDAVDVSVLGWRVKSLNFNKRMMCTYIGQPPNPEVSKDYCPNYDPEKPSQITAVAMNCTVTSEVYKSTSSIHQDNHISTSLIVV